MAVLAQQVKTSDGVYRLRPWNPFSPQHLTAIDDEEMQFKQNSASHLIESEYPCTLAAEFLLQNLCDDSIEIFETSVSKQGLSERHLEEARSNMNYAKWFRPILCLALTIMLLLVLLILEDFGVLKALKEVYEAFGPPERLDIVFSLTLITGSKMFALAIDALIAAIGIFMLVSGLGWWYPNFSWVSVLCFVQGSISLAAAVFWLCV